MNKYNQVLERFGLNKNEVKLYLACLNSEPQNITNLSKVAKVKRTTAYGGIEKLKSLGLITQKKNNKKVFFQSTDPQILLKKSKENISSWQNLTNELNSILPTLQSLYSRNSSPSNIQIFEGIDNIIKVKEEFFTQFRKYKIGYQLGDAQKTFQIIGSKSITQKLTSRRRQIKDTKFFIVTDQIPADWQKTLQADQDFRQIKLLPKSQNFNSTIVVCGNKTWIVKLTSPPTVVSIEDSDIARLLSFTILSIWNNLKVN